MVKVQIFFRWAVWKKKSCNDLSGFQLAFQCVAVCCSVLQCVAVCYSVLQWRAVMIFQDSNLHSDEPVSSVCVVVRYSVLQCVAVRCSVMIFQNTDLHSNDHFESRLFGNALYCVAACRSAMQYVPVCCRSISSLVFSGTDCIVHLYLNVLLPYSRNSCSHMFIWMCIVHLYLNVYRRSTFKYSASPIYIHSPIYIQIQVHNTFNYRCTLCTSTCIWMCFSHIPVTVAPICFFSAVIIVHRRRDSIVGVIWLVHVC